MFVIVNFHSNKKNSYHSQQEGEVRQKARSDISVLWYRGHIIFNFDGNNAPQFETVDVNLLQSVSLHTDHCSRHHDNG